MEKVRDFGVVNPICFYQALPPQGRGIYNKRNEKRL